MRNIIRTLKENNIDLIATDEEFKSIAGWKDYYISSYGRVLSIKNGKCKILKQQTTENGYQHCTLTKPARRYKGRKVKNSSVKSTARIHRLVAMAFCNNPYDMEIYSYKDLEVHHKDGNPQNNHYSNLMWLCKTKNGRTDHDLIHMIKRIGTVNGASFRRYKDIEKLVNLLDVDLLELLDIIRYGVSFRHDGYNVYQVNERFIGVEFYPNCKDKNQSQKKKSRK